MTHSETTDQRTNVLSGTIISDRFLGEKRRTLVQLEYGRKIEVKRQPDEIALSNGAKVLVTIPENAVFLFNYPLYGLDDAINVT
ncbi:MAG: TOBE domain-containing protein [Candidatus Heimdallarchaeota archaeon]|nr:TOBE domain-containing protein [Candidatus Heimdallarchaeota archaeon]